MLFHHDGRAYKDAASNAATRAREKLEKQMNNGRENAVQLLNRVQDEVPDDYIVPTKDMNFITGEDAILLEFDHKDEEVLAGMHRHAFRQAADRAKIPRRWADAMVDGKDWERELLAHNLNTLFEHRGGTYLVRSVDDEVRGFLSNRFRLMDTAPIIEAFVEACTQLGAVPIEAYYTPTKVALKMILDVVFEPIENEVLAIGICLQNSDYGNGALSVRVFTLRLWCTNYAIADETLRQVHLGSRMDDSAFSLDTRRKYTDAMVSGVRDVVKDALGPEKVGGLLHGLVEANEQEIPSQQIKAFLKKHFNKDEAVAISEHFSSPEVRLLPPGQTKYRLSNAISLLAGELDNKVRRLEMQQVAGRLLLPAEA